MTAAANHDLEGPNCPERNYGDEAVVHPDYSSFLLDFQRRVVTEQALVVLFKITSLEGQLFFWNVRNGARGPNLAVGMRVAGTHHGAAIFEDLNMVDLRHCTQ